MNTNYVYRTFRIPKKSNQQLLAIDNNIMRFDDHAWSKSVDVQIEFAEDFNRNHPEKEWISVALRQPAKSNTMEEWYATVAVLLFLKFGFLKRDKEQKSDALFFVRKLFPDF